MPLSRHDQNVLADLNQTLVADDPHLARRLAPQRRRLPQDWPVLAAEMAVWIMIGTGIFLLVAFSGVAQLAQVGSALLFIGFLALMSGIVVTLQRRANGPSTTAAPEGRTGEPPAGTD